MTSREFCYWLQGVYEIESPKRFALVFKHEIDPSYENADELNDIHSGKKKPFGGDELIRC